MSNKIRSIVTVNCSNCNIEFTKTINVTRGNNHFCNAKCKTTFHRNKIKKSKVPSNTNVSLECKECKTQFIVNKARKDTAKFCSKICKSNNRTTSGWVELNCHLCDSKFKRLKSMILEKVFCSRKCSDEWNIINIKSKRKLHNCAICNKEFERPISVKYNITTCSKKCHYENLSVLSKTDPYYIELFKQRGINSALSQSNYDTKPELMVKEWLNANNIKFEAQLLMHDKFIVDFYLPKFNQVLEVNGDYWHANPIKYGEGKKELTDWQIKQRNKDKARKNYLEKCGYKFSIAWENDIYENVNELMEKLIIQNP